MTDQMPFEGFQAHDHDHPHQPSQPVQMPPVQPTPDEAIQAGAQHWLAREFVGGLIAMAQTHEVDIGDFLADRCILLAMRAATGESEVQVLRTQLQALASENRALQARIDDCGCHDEDSADNPPGNYAIGGQGANHTMNGASSA